MNDLERLRQKYEGKSGGAIFDTEFQKVADSQFSGEKRKWPFADVATFIGLPYLAEGVAAAAFADLDIAVVGVPMDLGVTNRAGARLGPRAVRSIERIGPFEHVLRVAPSTLVTAADIGDVPFRSRFDLSQCHADIEAYFTEIVAKGVIPLAVGGDH